MPALVVTAADAIQREVEAALTSRNEIYKACPLDEKLSLYINIATERMAVNLKTNFSALRPHITDFISLGASIYEPHHTMDAVKRASHLGLSQIELHSVDLGGASIVAALEIARRIADDAPRMVLIAGAEAPRSNAVNSRYYREVNDALLDKTLELHTHANLISLYALFADRMMFENGLTQKHVDDITRYYRDVAQSNDRAAMQGKNLKENELSRFLAGPYATPMVAVATDHGVAILVANERYFRAVKKKMRMSSRTTSLYIASVATNFQDKYVSRRADFVSPAGIAMSRALSRARLKRQAIDYAWIYDCFTLMLVDQAAKYFGIPVAQAAESLANGHIYNGKKKIFINESGGILNTQAAISLSAATGILDILHHAQRNLKAKTFLFGGNGGLDTVNAVAILTRNKPKKGKKSDYRHQPLRTTTVAKPLAENEPLTLHAAVIVRFNPGTDAPFALGSFRRSDGTLCLLRIVDAQGNNVLTCDELKRDATKAVVKIIDQSPLAALTV